MKQMKKWYGGLIFASIFMILVLRYATTQNPFGQTLGGSIPFNTTHPFEWVNVNPLEWVRSTAPAVFQTALQNTTVIPVDTLVSSLYIKRNLTTDERNSLLTWNRLTNLINNSQALPNAIEAFNEASHAWNSLMTVIEDEKLHVGGNSSGRTKEKQCPHYLNRMNTLELNDSQFRLLVPCGLTQGSSITIIGTPNGLLGDFQINLTGEQIPGETEPPIILHYNVRLHGDKVTEDPVIVQNTWTAVHDWGEEDRCPSPEPDQNKKVDELDQCNVIVGKDVNLTSKAVTHEKGSKKSGPRHDVAKTKRYFPFKQRYPFVATLRVGSEGIQMTVDGKHITSFAYRETLEPWLIGEVRISGDVQLISILASGLPTSEVIEHVHDLEVLKAVPIQYEKPLDLFIGIFSTANNFMRRMAVRRTWMQYPQVRSGSVAVRFFVGLHKNQRVNEELWNEARTYGDVQLMPFVDYYSLITWKTVAICIFGSHIVSANYVMKTDDDAFVRVDEVITSLNRINVTQGLLYGLINSDSQPHRNPDSKWFISTEEWPEDNYPPWAHGPGYVISHDVANAVAKRYNDGNLKMFKLEDVAMGIWIADMIKDGINVRYENEERVYNEGCKDNYVVAHYQSPREMLCLWRKLQETKRAFCCGDGKR